MKRVLCLLAVMATGCVPVTYKGQTYHLILGIGVFHVEQSNDVTVVRVKTLGLYTGDGRMNLGCSSIYSAHVPTNANVILDIK